MCPSVPHLGYATDISVKIYMCRGSSADSLTTVQYVFAIQYVQLSNIYIYVQPSDMYNCATVQYVFEPYLYNVPAKMYLPLGELHVGY